MLRQLRVCIVLVLLAMVTMSGSAMATHENSTLVKANEYTAKCSERNLLACDAAIAWWHAYSHGGQNASTSTASYGVSNPCPEGIWKRAGTEDKIQFVYTDGRCQGGEANTVPGAGTFLAIAALVSVALVVAWRRL